MASFINVLLITLYLSLRDFDVSTEKVVMLSHENAKLNTEMHNQ